MLGAVEPHWAPYILTGVRARARRDGGPALGDLGCTQRILNIQRTWSSKGRQVALLGQGGSYSTSPVRMATPASRRPTPSSVTATM